MYFSLFSTPFILLRYTYIIWNTLLQTFILLYYNVYYLETTKANIKIQYNLVNTKCLRMESWASNYLTPNYLFVRYIPPS
jgi:hypothetical protein